MPEETRGSDTSDAAPKDGGSLRFGVIVPNSYLPGTDPRKALAETVELTELARDLNYDAVQCGEHRAPDVYYYFTPLTLVSRLAAVAGDMNLIAVSLVANHWPVPLAEDLAALDVVCGNRLIVAAALGYRDVEYMACGFAREGRVGRLRNGLAVMRQLWTDETFEGELDGQVQTFTSRSAACGSGGPEVWLAANNDNAVARAGRLGLPWLINGHADLPTLIKQRATYRDTWAAASTGRSDPTVPLVREVIVHDDADEAWRIARKYLQDKYRTSYMVWGQDKAISADESFDRAFEDLANQRFVIGDPVSCAQQISAIIRAVGADFFVVHCSYPGMPKDKIAEIYRLCAEKVFPIVVHEMAYDCPRVAH